MFQNCMFHEAQMMFERLLNITKLGMFQSCMFHEEQMMFESLLNITKLGMFQNCMFHQEQMVFGVGFWGRLILKQTDRFAFF